jgi:hypothetical protein
MGTARRSGSICLPILLVATAIQGVTPDPDDLASPRLVQVLESVLSPAVSWANDFPRGGYVLLLQGAEPPLSSSEPCQNDDEELNADEPGVLAERVGVGLFRHKPSKFLKLESVKAGRPRPSPRCGHRRMSRGSDTIGYSGGLIHFLCRLNC